MKTLYATCLIVENLEKSLFFYKNILGLSIHSQDDGYVDFLLGDMVLGLFEKNKATAMFPIRYMNKGGGVIFAYQVADVAKASKELETKGVNIFEGPKKTPWGQTVAYFQDPDNNIWEITNE